LIDDTEGLAEGDAEGEIVCVRVQLVSVREHVAKIRLGAA
jgi:hypothetical protein